MTYYKLTINYAENDKEYRYHYKSFNINECKKFVKKFRKENKVISTELKAYKILTQEEILPE